MLTQDQPQAENTQFVSLARTFRQRITVLALHQMVLSFTRREEYGELGHMFSPH